jgi:hypothetical protein
MIVQDCFQRLHDAFTAAQAESASLQAVIGDGDNSIDTWTQIADKLEAHGNRIDVAITNVFRALEEARGVADPRLH